MKRIILENVDFDNAGMALFFAKNTELKGCGRHNGRYQEFWGESYFVWKTQTAINVRRIK